MIRLTASAINIYRYYSSLNVDLESNCMNLHVIVSDGSVYYNLK